MKSEGMIDGRQQTTNTYHCSGALVPNVVITTSRYHLGVPAALIQFDPIVVEKHIGEFSGINNGSAAVGDDVVAAGDGGEDACLDVHRTVSSSRSVGVIELHRDPVVVDDGTCLVPVLLEGANHLEGQVPQSLLNCRWENFVQLILYFSFATLHLELVFHLHIFGFEHFHSLQQFFYFFVDAVHLLVLVHCLLQGTPSILLQPRLVGGHTVGQVEEQEPKEKDRHLSDD